MVTEHPDEAHRLAEALQGSSWTGLTEVINRSAEWLDREPMGTAGSEMVIAAMVDLAAHEKWEVRRALAVAAGTSKHAKFDEALSRLTADANARVQQAAETASLKRRDWRAAGLLGREHEGRLDRVLDEIQAKFGTPGRLAVRRAANEMVSTFARELYHEMVRHLTPLDREIQRLHKGLNDGLSASSLAACAAQIEQDASQVKAVLKAMREYAASPDLTFARESLRDVVAQAARTAEPVAERWGVAIENKVDQAMAADVSRARLIQALSNLLCNAVEAYAGMQERRPIAIDASASDAAVTICVRDHGVGMSAETVADARTLFSTSKEQGTGVGLPLAIKIVESEHEGRLEIESEEHRGTTVTLSWPRHRKR